MERPKTSPEFLTREVVEPQPVPRRSFVVRTVEEGEERRRMLTTFEYSKSVLSAIVLLLPTSKQFLAEVPMTEGEMQDVLVMSITVFLQIMHLIHNQKWNSWDNSDMKSRIALAMSLSISAKYVMDVPPIGALYALSYLLKPGEADCSQELMLSYIQRYECIVVKNVSLYRSYFNHKMRAHEVLADMLDAARVSSTVASFTEELLFFFSFHVSEWLSGYWSTRECYIGPALVLLSLECLNVLGLVAAGTEPCGDVESYRLAAGMAADVSAKDTVGMQQMLNTPFTDHASWQRRATTQSNIKKARMELDKRATSMA